MWLSLQCICLLPRSPLLIGLKWGGSMNTGNLFWRFNFILQGIWWCGDFVFLLKSDSIARQNKLQHLSSFKDVIVNFEASSFRILLALLGFLTSDRQSYSGSQQWLINWTNMPWKLIFCLSLRLQWMKLKVLLFIMLLYLL